MALLTSTPAKHHSTSPRIVPCALLPLTLQDHIPSTFAVVIGLTMKGVYFRWLTNFDSQKINLNFLGTKTPHNLTESRKFLYRNQP
jgi:hypothetical protein